MSILAHRISYLTHYKSVKKAYDDFATSKKRSVEFQPSQWNSTKKNEHSNLFVRSQKFLRTHKSKKKEVPKFVSRLFSYSHLASKFSFGEHPYQTLGRPKHPWALFGSDFPKASLQQFNGFLSVASLSTRFNISFEANDEAKDAKQQDKLAASVFKPTSSWKHVLFPHLKIFCFPTKQNNF